MHPARNRNPRPETPAKKAWSKPELSSIELTGQELALVNRSEDPKSVLARIHKQRRDAEKPWNG